MYRMQSVKKLPTSIEIYQWLYNTSMILNYRHSFSYGPKLTALTYFSSEKEGGVQSFVTFIAFMSQKRRQPDRLYTKLTESTHRRRPNKPCQTTELVSKYSKILTLNTKSFVHVETKTKTSYHCTETVPQNPLKFSRILITQFMSTIKLFKSPKICINRFINNRYVIRYDYEYTLVVDRVERRSRQRERRTRE